MNCPFCGNINVIPPFGGQGMMPPMQQMPMQQMPIQQMPMQQMPLQQMPQPQLPTPQPQPQ